MSTLALSTMQGFLSKTQLTAPLARGALSSRSRRCQANDRRHVVIEHLHHRRLVPSSHAFTSYSQQEHENHQSDGDRTEAEEAAEEVAKAAHGNPFDWLSHWYPVALESATPKDRPTAVKLLGRDLVLWHDGTDWRCFEDRCPHRAVPLSEGRVETAAAAAVTVGSAAERKKAAKNLPKELQCAYHGFQFAFDGACTAVPQAISREAEQKARTSPRACAAVYPLRSCGDGLLWVWPKEGDFVNALAIPTGQHALLDTAFDPADGKETGKVSFFSPYFQRDIPFDIDVLAENVVDPSHVFFSHHGILGSRYAPPLQQMIAPPPLPRGMKPDPSVDPVAEAEEAGGFAVKQLLHSQGKEARPPPEAEIPSSKRDRFDKKLGTILWKPPTQSRYDFSHNSFMIVHGTPLSPGRTRLFFAVYRSAVATPPLMRFLLKILASPPLRFLAHHGNNNVLDGDNVFLAAQGTTLRNLEAQGKSFRDVYFMPTSMDAAVARVRGWFARHGGFGGGGGGIPWAPGSSEMAPPPPTRFEALERFESHTKNCPDCMRAFRAFNFLRNAAAALCGASLAWAIGSAAAAAASSLRSRALLSSAAPALAVAAAAAVAFFVLRREAQKFVFVDYVHADHD